MPADYVANTATSLADIQAAGYETEVTSTLVNCPVVPDGSTADLGGGADGLTRGWYKDQVVFYFSFEEHALMTTPGGEVPLSPIYVTFNINPGEPGGGPPSGFLTETGMSQTHNVVATLPGDAGQHGEPQEAHHLQQLQRVHDQPARLLRAGPGVGRRQGAVGAGGDVGGAGAERDLERVALDRGVEHRAVGEAAGVVKADRLACCCLAHRKDPWKTGWKTGLPRPGR